MAEEAYHHGNLRNELIETGIKLINEEGIENFTLRRVAKRVGVSAPACYNHFANKEQLLLCMKEYVNERFEQVLMAEVKGSDNGEIALKMGAAYVCFFAKNPHYFTFFFDSEDCCVELTADEFDSNYKPFCIFKEYATKWMKEAGMPQEKYRENLIAMWAMVQGLASMANMKGFHYDGNWGKLTEKILKEKIKIIS